jgi:hypothetical protein
MIHLINLAKVELKNSQSTIKPSQGFCPSICCPIRTNFNRHCEEAVGPTKQSQLIVAGIASPQKARLAMTCIITSAE